jgi:hypothetical protein
MDLKAIGWKDVNWIHLAQVMEHWAGACEHGNEPSGSITRWEYLKPAE